MTEPRSRLRKAARIAGYAGAVLVVLAIVVAIGAPVYYRGERFGRLVAAAMPAMRGKVHVGGGRWSWGVAWALARARPATIAIDDVTVTDPEGTEVFYVRRASARVTIHRGLTEEWLVQFRERRNERLMAGVRAIPGAVEAVARISERFQGRIACCSGADRWKVEMQLAKCGLLPYFEGRIYSGHEMPRSKPAPDVYLAAMAPLGVEGARCAVVEDTVTGVTAGIAAGAVVFGFSPPEAGHDAPGALRAAGATEIFSGMTALPALLG